MLMRGLPVVAEAHVICDNADLFLNPFELAFTDAYQFFGGLRDHFDSKVSAQPVR